MKAEIGLEEWLAEFAKLTRRDDAGMTSEEIGAKTGHSAFWAREKIIQPAKAAGCLILGFRNGESVSGRSIKTPVYRFTELPKKK